MVNTEKLLDNQKIQHDRLRSHRETIGFGGKNASGDRLRAVLRHALQRGSNVHTRLYCVFANSQVGVNEYKSNLK